MMGDCRGRSRWVLGMVLGALPGIVAAHSGAVVDASGLNGFAAGFSHPFSGLDHVLAMIAAGLWASQLGGRAHWWVPLVLVDTMILGGALGAVGIAVPGVEQGIVASVLMLGVLVAAAVRLPLAASSLLVGVFALCHGHAHGAEMPVLVAGVSYGVSYGVGFAVASAGLHVLGIGIGGAGRGLRGTSLVRLAGATVAAAGVVLAVSLG